jgi:hypothetical protein
MPAYVWNTKPRMWKVVPPVADSLTVLKAYITDVSVYIYCRRRGAPNSQELRTRQVKLGRRG